MTEEFRQSRTPMRDGGRSQWMRDANHMRSRGGGTAHRAALNCMRIQMRCESRTSHLLDEQREIARVRIQGRGFRAGQ